MTARELISIIDSIKPNAFSEEAKLQWVNEAEGYIWTEVMLNTPITFEEIGLTGELMVKPPHNELYWPYLMAMIDLANGDYERYTNSMQLYNDRVRRYMRWYADNYRPADSDRPAPEYAPDPYEIAKERGFEGTKEQWLAQTAGTKTTAEEVIAFVDAIKPNYFDTAAKLQWLNEVEAHVWTEVMLNAPLDFTAVTEQTITGELLVAAPHSEIYWPYLSALIDFANGDYDRYNNTMELYTHRMRRFMRWYADTYRPADGTIATQRHYISAYAIAVAHGFTGTEEDWLASLKGDKGDIGPAFTVADVYQTLDELRAAFPDGALGIYAVENEGYIYSPTEKDWITFGSLQGPQGEKGEKGEKGDTGPAGPTGPRGELGPVGPQGSIGPTGPQGVQGIQGPAGPTGPQGNAGAIGPEGPAGPQGPAGPTGEVGLTYYPIINQGMLYFRATKVKAESEGDHTEAVDIKGEPGEPGSPGENGWTYIPNVDENGDLTWSLRRFNGSRPEIAPAVNIRGPEGAPGDDYNLTDADKEEIAETVLEELNNKGYDGTVAWDNVTDKPFEGGTLPYIEWDGDPASADVVYDGGTYSYYRVSTARYETFALGALGRLTVIDADGNYNDTEIGGNGPRFERYAGSNNSFVLYVPGGSVLIINELDGGWSEALPNGMYYSKNASGYVWMLLLYDHVLTVPETLKPESLPKGTVTVPNGTAANMVPVSNGKGGVRWVNKEELGGGTVVEPDGPGDGVEGDGLPFQTDNTLKYENGVLGVNTATDAEQDNTLPITSAAVYETLGNIELLLGTI